MLDVRWKLNNLNVISSDFRQKIVSRNALEI